MASRTRNRRQAVAMHPIHDAVRPFLVSVVRLHQADAASRPEPATVHERVRALLDETIQGVGKLDLDPEDVEAVRYALVAFADEMMQAEPGPLRDHWQQHLLQLSLFGETRAGEGFYRRLEALRADGARLPALHVYYLCLLFGFRGMYIKQPMEREHLVDATRRALVEGSLHDPRPPLAPRGARPDEPAADRQRNRLVQWLAVGALAMGLLWYIGSAFVVNARSLTLRERIEEQTRQVGGTVGHEP